MVLSELASLVAQVAALAVKDEGRPLLWLGQCTVDHPCDCYRLAGAGGTNKGGVATQRRDRQPQRSADHPVHAKVDVAAWMAARPLPDRRMDRVGAGRPLEALLQAPAPLRHPHFGLRGA